MPSVAFQAVLNCGANEIKDFTDHHRLPDNLELIPQKVDVQSYYQESF